MAQAPPHPELISEFVKWRYAAGRSSSSALTEAEEVAGFTAKLRAEGKSAAEAEAAMKEVQEYREFAEGVRWDTVFANPDSKVNRKPNRWLMEAVKDRKPGKALDIGMGFGRNSISLAQLGWDVTGFDIASQSVERANQNAGQMGVAIKAMLASEQKFDYGKEQWDLVVDTYEFSPVRTLYPRIWESLKPGGIWVIEGFEKSETVKFGYESGELLERLRGMRILKYEEVEDVADYGLRKVPVIRVVAQKR